jgi:hypothetical protein
MNLLYPACFVCQYLYFVLLRLTICFMNVRMENVTIITLISLFSGILYSSQEL